MSLPFPYLGISIRAALLSSFCALLSCASSESAKEDTDAPVTSATDTSTATSTSASASGAAPNTSGPGTSAPSSASTSSAVQPPLSSSSGAAAPSVSVGSDPTSTGPTDTGSANMSPTDTSPADTGSSAPSVDPSATAASSGAAGGGGGMPPTDGTAGGDNPPNTMEPTWIGAWGTAPQLAESGTPSDNRPPSSLVNNTLRQVIFPTISGSKIRLELSNGWGSGPLDIQAVHIATAAEAGAIVTETDTPLTFGGMASTTIPAQGTIWSDPVDFELTALARVSISIRFGASVPSDFTSHPGSRTTSYIQTGDAVSSADLTSGTKTDHWYYITRLDTETTDPASGAIVTFGDSITDGRGSTTNANNRWPDALARKLQANEATRSISVLNMGIGGNAVVSGGLGPTGMSRFDRDVLGQSRVRWVIILHGINDIGNGSGNVAPQLTAAYAELIQRAKDANVKVFGAPLLPFAGSSYSMGAGHTDAHAEANEWIRSTGDFDAIIDFSTVVADPNDPSRLNGMYLFENDYLHLNAAGYEAMGNSIDLSLFQ